MNDLRCINCQNHAKFNMECLINHPNYKNKLTADLSSCYVRGEHLKSMDKMIELLDKMNDILDKKQPTNH